MVSQYYLFSNNFQYNNWNDSFIIQRVFMTQFNLIVETNARKELGITLRFQKRRISGNSLEEAIQVAKTEAYPFGIKTIYEEPYQWNEVRLSK